MIVVLKEADEEIAEFEASTLPRVGDIIQIWSPEEQKPIYSGCTAWKVDQVRFFVKSSIKDEIVVLNVSPSVMENPPEIFLEGGRK